MKIAHIIVLVALVGSTFAEECRVFACGSVNQEGDTDRCGGSTGEGTAQTWAFQECPTDATFGLPRNCETGAWNTPQQATEFANCGANAFLPQWPEALQLADGQSVVGDFCNQDSHCAGASTCNADTNICIASMDKGGDCAADADNTCPVGQWCLDQVCTDHLGDGAVCTREAACPRSHSCIKVGDAADFTCTALRSLEHGTEFELLPAANDLLKEGKTAATGQRFMTNICKTWAAVAEDDGAANVKWQCRNADINVNTERLTDGGNGVDCEVKTWEAPAFADFDNEGSRKTSSLCGFNKDNRGVCPLQLGDTFTLDLLNAAFDAEQGLECHKTSAGLCDALQKAKQAEVQAQDAGNAPLFGGHRAGQTIEGIGGAGANQLFANVANNDKCVAAGVTQNFWNGLGNAYISFGAVSAFATVLFAALN